MTTERLNALLDSLRGLNGILDVVTVKATPKGFRFVTLDSHASHAIEHMARRKGFRVITRFDHQTLHYRIGVTG